MIVACPKCDLRYDASGRRANDEFRCRCGTLIVVPAAASTAAAINCPSCGASVNPDSTICAYCDASLGLRRCPACQTVAFSGARHCSECGRALGEPARPVQPDENALCPDCNQPMLRSRVGGKPAHLCSKCSGLWLDHALINDLVKKAQRKPSLRSLLGWPPDRTYRRDEVRYKPCPECRDLMRRLNFGKRSGVIVDVCNAHGTWFDRGELAAVLRFVRDTAGDAASNDVSFKSTIDETGLDEALRHLEQLLSRRYGG